jgi:hypothetical protein
LISDAEYDDHVAVDSVVDGVGLDKKAPNAIAQVVPESPGVRKELERF